MRMLMPRRCSAMSAVALASTCKERLSRWLAVQLTSSPSSTCLKGTRRAAERATAAVVCTGSACEGATEMKRGRLCVTLWSPMPSTTTFRALAQHRIAATTAKSCRLLDRDTYLPLPALRPDTTSRSAASMAWCATSALLLEPYSTLCRTPPATAALPTSTVRMLDRSESRDSLGVGPAASTAAVHSCSSNCFTSTWLHRESGVSRARDRDSPAAEKEMRVEPGNAPLCGCGTSVPPCASANSWRLEAWAAPLFPRLFVARRSRFATAPGVTCTATACGRAAASCTSNPVPQSPSNCGSALRMLGNVSVEAQAPWASRSGLSDPAMRSMDKSSCGSCRICCPVLCSKDNPLTLTCIVSTRQSEVAREAFMAARELRTTIPPRVTERWG